MLRGYVAHIEITHAVYLIYKFKVAGACVTHTCSSIDIMTCCVFDLQIQSCWCLRGSHMQ